MSSAFRFLRPEAQLLQLLNPFHLLLSSEHRRSTRLWRRRSGPKVVVVQENSGKFKGTGVWKLPTGVVNEGAFQKASLEPLDLLPLW
ncbi:hypothetical protein CMV_016927 [Castanea mollissima]|uniref:Uncharacterized protein n=1 Tax=Castanea mollissima TaxID=60419 RepID=A0A8J4R318_9ROSI|nr:hypothetical protein CMV_016927 [Castanea mollissima]